MDSGSKHSSYSIHISTFCAMMHISSKLSNTMNLLREVVFLLQKTYTKELVSIDSVPKEDLNMINHLSGKTQKYIKLTFSNEQDLMIVRKELLPIINKNKEEKQT